MSIGIIWWKKKLKTYSPQRHRVAALHRGEDKSDKKRERLNLQLSILLFKSYIFFLRFSLCSEATRCLGGKSLFFAFIRVAE